MSGFKRAERKRVWLKMAVTGPSGSGKTYSGLRMAFGLTDKNTIAVIDTENGSASLYADIGAYDVLDITAPFTVQKYVEAIREAVAGGYDVLVIDSLSHVWAGDGGLLQQKEARDARGGNSYTNWGEITKLYEQLKTVILQSPIHIIATMRSKQDYVIETDSRGKQSPRKVGLAPVQRDGFEYEFTTVFDVDMTHTAATSKDRTGLFTDQVAQITEEHGARIKTWLDGGAEPALAQTATFVPQQQPLAQPANPDEYDEHYNVVDRMLRELDEPKQASAVEHFQKTYKVERVADLRLDQLIEYRKWLRSTYYPKPAAATTSG